MRKKGEKHNEKMCGPKWKSWQKHDADLHPSNRCSFSVANKFLPDSVLGNIRRMGCLLYAHPFFTDAICPL